MGGLPREHGLQREKQLFTAIGLQLAVLLGLCRGAAASAAFTAR